MEVLLYDVLAWGGLGGMAWATHRYGFGTVQGLLASLPFFAVCLAGAYLSARKIGWL